MLDNIYVTVVLVALLMFLDYFLTLRGFKLYKIRYAQFVQAESYELNPKFKHSIKNNTYNFKHFIFIILLNLFLYAYHYISFHGMFWFTPTGFYFLQGLLFSLFICVNARHIQNLMIFNAVNKNPSMLSGKLKQTTLFALKSSQAQSFSLFLIFIMMFLFSPNAFFFGFAVATLLMLYTHHRWIKKL